MELPVIVHELRTLYEEYKKRLTDKEPATVVYCNGFCSILQKFLDKHNGSYEEYVFSLCIFLCHYAASYGELAIDNAKEKICQQLFRLCIKAVLDVKWKELSEDNTCRQKFRETVDAVHTQLERFDFYQFQLIKTLMETHWDHPTLSRIMAGADDLEEQEVMEYFAEEDPIVLKVRVEMLLDENCEEFALNLCKWCCLHPALVDNVEIRETQLFMLYRTGNVDKMQEECAKISSEMAVQIIKNLQECEAQQSFCVMIAQTFLVQNWVRGLSADSGTKTLLKLWIRLQYLVDGDLDKFSDSIWAIAKLSQHTEQITFLVEALREEAGDTFLQLNTNLCIYAFNLDKGCLEQAVADKDMELILCRNVALSKTSQMIMNLYHGLCPKLAKLSAVTAFALDPSEENFEIVYTIFHFTNHGSLSSYSITSQHEDNLLDSNSPNKFVNKLTNMLDSLHVSPTKETKRLRPKTKAERNRHSMSHRTVDNVEYCGLSVNPATLYEVERLLNNICPFHLDIEINFTDLRNICMEHLTRHQEMLMVLHEESTDECSEYSSFDDEQADRARLSGDLIDLPDNAASELPLDIDNSSQKLDGCVVTEYEQEVGDAKCMCGPPLDVISQKSCQSLFEANNVKYNTTKMTCHSNQTCPNSVSSRNLFDAFNRDLSSKACSSQQEEQYHLAVDVTKTSNTIDKEVGYCANISEKTVRFPSCGASAAGSCKCDKSLSVHTCLSFDSQIDFANMMDNVPIPSVPHTLHGIEKSSSNITSKLHKMRVRDEHCCCNSLPSTVNDGNTVHVPTSLKCMCKIKGKSSKKSDKSLKCDKKLQQVPESNNNESQSKSSSHKVLAEDFTANDKLLEKLKSCISAQTGSDLCNVNEKFTLSKMEKSYIDRYCQFLKTVRQFEMAMLTQKSCKPSTKQKRNYLVVYRCGICCEFFDQVSDLKEHIQSICKAAVMDMKNLTEAASIFCTKDSVLSKIKFFKCLKCLQYTCTRREMDDHLKLCGVPLAKKSSKTADIASPVHKVELHKPSLGNPFTSTDSLQLIENNNNNVSLVKTENDPISEVLPSINDSAKILLCDEEGMSAEINYKKLDAPNIEMNYKVKCPEENVDKNIKPKVTNEEYFKCQMCGRLLLGPHRHRLHLEACKKRCEWRKDRRLKRMSLAKPSEKARSLIKKEIPITSSLATTLSTTTMSNATVKELPMSGINKMSTSRDNLSNNSAHSNVVETKNEIKPKPPIPQPEKPKHCPDCERIIKLRKVSQQLGISEKMLIKTEPQETTNRQTQVLHPSSKQSNNESHLVMSESEVDAAATAATAAVVAAAAADLQIETTNTQAINDKMNTDECIKRTMLQIKSEMENKQLMEKKVESQHCRISNSVSNLLPTSSVPRVTYSKNKLIVNSSCNLSNATQNSDIAKCKVGSFVKGHLRKRSVGGASPYCRMCDLKFRNRSDFVKHLAITHLQPYTKKIPDPDSNTVIFHCNFCQGAFQVWFKYINHIPNHSALILERLNCKLVEETYSVADEKPFTSSIDLTGYSDNNDKANHSKSSLKKTHLKLVWPPPEEDIGTFFKRKRRRGTHKSRRTARHSIPHPNPSLGNLSKTTIMNFTQTSNDADDSTKKEILQVMNDLLQKIVGSNEQDHNIMDVGSMPKSVTEKRKTVSLPVHSISSSCPSSNPISNVAASAVVPFHIPHTTDQSCTKEISGYNAKISATAVLNETSAIVLEKVIKTQQKGEISTDAASLCCPLQKISEGGKISTPRVSPHSSKNSANIQSCLTSVNVFEKSESICSFNKGDVSLKDSVLKASFESCSKNASIQDKDQDRNSIITSDDKKKDGCSNLKTCNTKLENSEDKCSGKNKEVSLISQHVDAVKKNDFSDSATKMMQDKLESTCLHSSLFLPILCKPSFPHFSCVSPSLSSSDTPSASLLIPDPAYISNKFTSQASVSLTTPVTTPHATSVPTTESVPATISKSASNSVVLFTSSARATPSSTALFSLCTHISEPIINTPSCTVSSSRSHPAVTDKPVSFDSSTSTLANTSPSTSSFVTLQSLTSFVQTTTTFENCVSSSLSLCPNSPFTSTKVLSSITANSVPYSICVCTANLSSASLLSKSIFTATPIQMHQTFTTGPTPSTCITITNPLSTITDSVSTSNANSLVSISSGAVNMASMSFTPPVTTINLSTISVSSVKAPILSTSLSFKPANISVASSTSNVTCQNLYSTDNKTEALSSKSVISESNLSPSLKPKTLSADISKITENELNLVSSTITNINTTETIKQTASTILGSSTTEICNLIDTAVPKATSALNMVSTEVNTGLKTTAITKSADLNTTFKTISTVCPMMQSNAGIISLQSSTVPNMVPTLPFDMTTMQSATNLSVQRTALSPFVPSTTVLIQPPGISVSNNCSINNLALPSAVNSNTITAISESLTSVVKAPSNASANTAFTLPTSNVSLSSSLVSSLNNNSVGSASTNSTTCFQMKPSVRTSVSRDPALSIVSANLAFPATCKSSVITVSANTSTITVSKPASSVCTIKTCVTLEKPTAISSSVSTTTATSKVYTSNTSTLEASKSSAISVNKTCAAVSVANSSFLASKTVTSKSTEIVPSSKTFMASSKTSTSIAANIVLTASSKPITIVSPAKNSHSTLKVSPGITPSNIITAVSKCATTVATNKTSTAVSTIIVPKITSVVSASSAAIETLKLSTISKSKISNIVSKTAPTISTAALTPSSSVSTILTSRSKSPTVNISESSCFSGVLANCSEVTKSLNARPLMHYTQKSLQGNCAALSYITTTEKAYTSSTTAIDTTESNVSSFSTPSTPETITALSTATFNSSASFSPSSTFTTSSLPTTTVTSSITATVSSTSAIKQSVNKSDNDQIIAPITDLPNLAAINISSQVNISVQPLTKEASIIKTESVHCSGVDSVSKSIDDCTKVVFCISEGDKLKTKSLNDSKLMITSQHSGMPDIEEKVLEPNISCQSRTTLHCSQTVKHLSNIEDFCSNTIVTPKCEIDSKNIDLSNVKTSNYVNYTTNSAFEHFSCNKEAETDNCDVKLSTAYENMSCNLMNPTCEEVTVTYNKDNPVSLSGDCKFGCNQKNTESCEKESLYINDVKAKYKEVLESSNDSSLSSTDGIKEGLTYKTHQSSRSNECSQEGMNPDAIYETYSSIDKKTAEYKEVAILKSQNSAKDSDKQCKKQWPVKVASEVLSEVDDSKGSTKTKCQDKEKIHTHTKQLRRPRGRPRKTNTELLLSSVASRQKLLNPGNIINFRLRKDRPTLKTAKCRYCCCKKRCQMSCVQNKCKSCITEGTSACRCNLTESQLSSMQKVALSNSTMCLNCHSNNKRASRVSKRKRSPSPKPIRRRSNIHSPLRSSSVSNQKTSSNTRLQKISNVPFKKKLSNSPHKSVVGSSHKKSLAGSHKKMTGVNLKKLSNEYRKQKQFALSSDKNFTEEFSKESSIISLKSGPSDALQDTKNVSNLVTRRTLRSRKSLDEATPVIRQLRRSKSEQKLDSCTDDISKKQTELLSVDNANGTLINYKLSQNISVENKTNVPLSCCNTEEDCCKICTENVGKKFVGNRALKELRQRVKLGPFKWDLEESETGGRAHSMPEDDECTVSTTDITATSATNLVMSKDIKVSTHSSLHTSHLSMPSSPASSPFSSSPSATADDELLGTGVTPPIRTYSRTQSPPSRIRVGRTYSKASDYQALPPGVMPVMPIIDCLRPTSHSSASHLCDMPRVHVVRVDKKGNMFETREPYPLPRNPLDLDMGRNVVDDEKVGGHRWKLQRTKMKTDGYPFSFKKTRIQ